MKSFYRLSAIISLASGFLRAGAVANALPDRRLHVHNGRGDASNGQWSWGEPLADYFDAASINVVNRARGGPSSRTFLTEGLWDEGIR